MLKFNKTQVCSFIRILNFQNLFLNFNKVFLRVSVAKVRKREKAAPRALPQTNINRINAGSVGDQSGPRFADSAHVNSSIGNGRTSHRGRRRSARRPIGALCNALAGNFAGAHSGTIRERATTICPSDRVRFNLHSARTGPVISKYALGPPRCQ